VRLLQSLLRVSFSDEVQLLWSQSVAKAVNYKNTHYITPRLLTKNQAAAYCGVSVATFATLCPVRPIALGNSKRLERFDTRTLDLWIDRLADKGTTTGKDWLATWEANSDPRSR
jgi:hypothetical protein